MNVFIDTNVFLSFCHLTNYDLEELRKLKVLLEKGNVVLHLLDQTVDESRRNRESKIADALKRLQGRGSAPLSREQAQTQFLCFLMFLWAAAA